MSLTAFNPNPSKPSVDLSATPGGNQRSSRMIEASARQGVAVDRISFVDALRWLEQAEPGDDLPKLVVNPDRPNRYGPRVRKRRPKSYPLMTKPRSELRKALLEQA